MNHIGRETPITVGGKNYTLRRYTRGVMNKVVEWAKSRIRHPLDIIKEKLEGFPPHIQEKLVDEAIREAKTYGSLNSDAINNEMNSIDGTLKTVQMLLKEQLDEDEVFQLFIDSNSEHGEEYLQNAIARAMGVPPPNETSPDEKKG